ncbi:TIGR00269 family protein [Methanobrevibacter filiformis]|uniref:tRNA 2-thiocytidine biosynthesis protein TtcA n=1 Tax=Methanobrevibacter filiformis TaxID=55758 RepID=A0A166CEQ5_9EURY|nr:TIGR00269 family protein [Methanobrevibacter filiformis]KZX13687.1 tRNA 2-thiocytidine biosynthesis protein TtcA [Methanobrevibacter filiformis]
MSIIEKKEFNKKIFSNIKSVVKDYDLIEKGDLIAIALSGGKDSVLTLHALYWLQNSPDMPSFDLIAISVNEGIAHYRNHGLESAVSNARDLDIPLIEKSFNEEYDLDLDDIYMNFKSACIPCGVFRRTILNKTAREVGADKIATGHNLDDEIQSFLMSFSRADIFKFSKFGPKLDKIHPKLVPRIKPLWNTKEKDVGTWAILNNMDIHLNECPYSNLSLRSKIKTFLNDLDSNNPGTKIAIMESFKKMFLDIKASTANLNQCQKCGEPCSGDICKSCDIIDILKLNKGTD